VATYLTLRVPEDTDIPEGVHDVEYPNGSVDWRSSVIVKN